MKVLRMIWQVVAWIGLAIAVILIGWMAVEVMSTFNTGPGCGLNC